ncbi:2-amino-4-hydroxy-6-hydroxymethyldihydropteridine diphosphokinase [Marinobacterium rhizophilum]|uniref:2-amino-4-hydroxy-6-hydroxymethyldihydropteridine diphosphokinase n=1 Tax=Marinobacterium rhizophilum TaxID=420402 RepID=A0ABY5HDZ1_9GAMM|nr:2-amino-4-hydroxy-6-hydroxymethyldihydropteridine diphosphokinase [Marinobacterium rhizophilum]
MYYYLSVGSNIDPEINIARCLEILLENFATAVVYPCTYTQPECIITDRVFINTLLVIRSNLDPVSLKAFFCSVEERLGRDRTDSERSRKDRTCDIDIITCSDDYSLSYFQACDESYLQQVLCASSHKVAVALFGSYFADRPATIYFDAAARDKLIIDYKSYALEDGFEARFSR